MSVTVMPGVLSMLAYLKSRGKRLGVASGNLEQIGWLKIEIAGLRDWFTFGGFSDRHFLRSEMVAQALAAGQFGNPGQGLRGGRHALGYHRRQQQFRLPTSPWPPGLPPTRPCSSISRKSAPPPCKPCCKRSLHDKSEDKSEPGCVPGKSCREQVIERGLRALGWHVDRMPRNVTHCDAESVRWYAGTGARWERSNRQQRRGWRMRNSMVPG